VLELELVLVVVGGDAAADVDDVAALELVGQLVRAFERARLDLALAVAEHRNQERDAVAIGVDDPLAGAYQRAVDPVAGPQRADLDRGRGRSGVGGSSELVLRGLGRAPCAVALPFGRCGAGACRCSASLLFRVRWTAS
jgi:hypothetical protein